MALCSWVESWEEDILDNSVSEVLVALEKRVCWLGSRNRSDDESDCLLGSSDDNFDDWDDDDDDDSGNWLMLLLLLFGKTS